MNALAAAAIYDAVVNLALEEQPDLGPLHLFDDLPESVQAAVVAGFGPLVPSILNVARTNYDEEPADG